jgi:hypothetical protein
MAHYPWSATERAINVQEVFVKTIEGQLNWNHAANAYLQQYFLPWHNRALSVPAGQAGSAFVPCPRPDRERIFALQHARTGAAENPVAFRRIAFQQQRSPPRVSFATCRVMVYEHLDDIISIGFGPCALGQYDGSARLLSHDDRTDHVLQKAVSFTCL